MNNLIILIILLSVNFALAFSKRAPVITETPVKVDAPAKIETPTNIVDAVKAPQEKVYSVLSWEVPSGERAAWSKTLIDAIEENFTDLNAAKDVSKFCPNYVMLDKNKKINAWGEFFVAIALYESGFNPKTDYFEKTMGYNSSGLFQLSYEDESWIKCGFDRKAKNIHDPHVNTRCAVKIMARQVRLKQKVFVDKGVYWAVIKPNGKFQKIKQITDRVSKSASFCN